MHKNDQIYDCASGKFPTWELCLRPTAPQMDTSMHGARNSENAT